MYYINIIYKSIVNILYGLYFQIYQTNYIPGIGKRNKSSMSLGYACDLLAKGIEDPLAYARKIIYELNKDVEGHKEVKIGDSSNTKNIGYFLLKSILDELEIDDYLQMLSSNKKVQFKFSDFVRSMIYAQVVNPDSKHKAFEKVFPHIYNYPRFSYDQIRETIQYIGADYQKFIELFNYQIDLKWKRKTNKDFFDCTNYYSEIDLPSEDKQVDPSKENRHCPIISQALLLDENHLPLAMSMFPGSGTEKPQTRKTIEDLKTRFDINTKIVQIDDKGLNCAWNICAASIEARGGHIFF